MYTYYTECGEITRAEAKRLERRNKRLFDEFTETGDLDLLDAIEWVYIEPAPFGYPNAEENFNIA